MKHLNSTLFLTHYLQIKERLLLYTLSFDEFHFAASYEPATRRISYNFLPAPYEYIERILFLARLNFQSNHGQKINPDVRSWAEGDRDHSLA
jgi:hypothetical protein